MSRKLIYPFLALLLAACTHTRPVPDVSFKDMDVPPAPDYSLMDYWVSHPTKEDAADLTPGGILEDKQSSAMADVFFIHPTTFYSDEQWNCDVNNEAINEKTERLPIRHQASIFNAAGRIYAPRYRQMNYNVFFHENERNLKGALRLAYSDVRSAFEYYLEHYNNGRPIIIAGHSQGSLHGMRLLKEFFDGTELQDQLVVAYLPGWGIRKDVYTSIPACNDSTGTGCLASWNTYQWGFEPDDMFRFEECIVTNPLNWKSDGTYAGDFCNAGAVGREYDDTYPQVCDAQAHDGILWIHKPHDIPGKFFLRKMKNYHIADYNFFWMNVRRNAELRVQKFLEQDKILQPVMEEIPPVRVEGNISE